MMNRQALARRAIPLLDLTDLSESCGPGQVEVLARRAMSLPLLPAAICIWPQYVGVARRMLGDAAIRVATVINFPAGGEDLERAVSDTQEALSDGAQEIDLVLPWRACLAGRWEIANDMVAAVAECLPKGTILKVILETGELRDPQIMMATGRLAINAGAHFLKTSTGKTPVSATPEAARVLLRCIADAGRPCGFKASGGLRTLEDAALYLDLADEIMGPGWATPKTFRFGASSLLDVLLAELDARED